MAESNLTFAKIVANPNAYSWSQAYNSGKLFAVLSLKTSEETGEKDYLNVLGKEIFNSLEQEYYTLETKELETIKQAVIATAKKIPAEIECSFVVSSIVNNVLYIYIVGNGKVALRREEKLGYLLESSDQKPDSLKVASGFLRNDDVIILETKEFANVVSVETLSEFLDNLNPKDAAENMAPLVHEKDEAGAASILIGYHAQAQTEEENIAPMSVSETTQVEISVGEETIEEPVIEEPEKEPEQKQTESPFYEDSIPEKKSVFKNISRIFSLVPKIRFPGKMDINHPRKVILTIVIVILIVFAGSIVFAFKKQQDAKTQAIFNSIYPQASKKYEEGQGLLELNQSLAIESFKEAKSILDGSKGKLPEDSKEEAQIKALLAKVNSALGPTQNQESDNTQAKQVDSSVSSLLNVEANNQAQYFSVSDKNVFAITDSGVSSFALDGGSKKTIIQNGGDWKQAGGLSNYYGNIYVLDKKQNQIIKYVAAESGYGKANYFNSNTTPDFSKAVSMAIDSSVYVLSSDGTISKFTKGAKDSFSVTGMSKAFLNPSAIFTTADLNNIYILDNGNSRIVVLDKTGRFVASYQNSVVKNAKDFDISEKDKKMYVLSSGKVYEMDLK